MDEIEISKLTPKAMREIAEGSEIVTVFDGETPVARIVPAVVTVKANANRFLHYPHDPAECFGTCWRHVQKKDVEELVSA